MISAAAVLLIAQSALPSAAAADASRLPARAAPIAERVTARATILRPARISFQELSGANDDQETRSHAVQRGRDAAGTVWIEFS